MARQDVENLLIAGGEDKHFRARYDVPATMEEFVALAIEDGYNFTVEELDTILKESGDVFEKTATRPSVPSGGHKAKAHTVQTTGGGAPET